MRKMIIIGGAFVFALVPAGLGLAANPSLSARVPIPPAQVRASPTARATPEATATPETTEPTASPTTHPSASEDDHGGDRHGRRSRGSGHDG